MENNQIALLEFIKSEIDKTIKDNSLDADVYEFISKRCDRALLANNEYMELQLRSVDSFRSGDMGEYADINTSMITVANVACYQTAIKDLIAILTKL